MMTLFSFIKDEEAQFKTLQVPVAENWMWNMWEHIKLSVLYKNSQFSSGDKENRPFKNITRPILNLQYRTEGFDVKDIEAFVDDIENYYKSFLVKKYHTKWAREVGLDTFIDEMVESYVDFGGALVKRTKDVRPEVVPLQRLAFCDQTDILSGPICEKHQYSPVQLKEMEKNGWENLDEVIRLSETEKTNTVSDGQVVQTPGKYIEVYELHGSFPTWWLEDEEPAIEDGMYQYESQLHIVTFYRDENGDKQGIILFQRKEKESPYRLILRDKIYGRALGLGGAEELFDPQVWVNYDVIRMKDLLDAASKVIFQSADPSFRTRNKLSNLPNMSVLEVEEGKGLTQINTQPTNMRLFENAVAQWEAHAQQMGAANDSIMGQPPTAGTPFKLQELVTAESHGLHDYRRGKLATFMGELYRDWFLQKFATEISNGQKFLSELSPDEMMQISDNLVTCKANEKILEDILNGNLIDEAEVQKLKEQTREDFQRGGSKKFIEILKSEMKDLPLDVEINVAGKQKNMAVVADKLVNVFRQLIASVNPQTGASVLDDPRMAKIFNSILEASGLDPMDFYSKPKPPPEVVPGQPQQMKQLASAMQK